MATVQNPYNLLDRGSEDVLDYCETHSIGFIPWFPLAAGNLAKQGSILDDIAKAHGVAPSQIALARVLKRSPRDAPHPWHEQSRPSRRECRRGQHPPVG